MRKSLSLFAAIGLSAVGLPGLVACNSSDSSASRAPEVPAASVVTVKRGTISHTLSLAGQFQPYQVVDVHAKVSGYIRHIYVDIGDKVHRGETLAVLEVPELDAQLKGSVSELGRSKDEVTRAQHEVARAQSIYSALHADYNRLQQASQAQPGLIAQQELDDAQSKDLAAASQVDAAKAALSAARQGTDVADANRQRVQDMNDYTRVTAPLDGVITWRYADTGALIQAGTSSDQQSLPVVKLAQSDLLRLRVPVPENAVRYVHVGQSMQVRVDALGRSLTGMVVRFTRDLDPATRTMQTEIDVPNKDLSLTPGMYANTELSLEHKEGILTVPVEAVVHDGDKQAVLVVDSNNEVQQRAIQTGLQGSELIEVTGGLREGERVIDGGQSKFQAGEKVQPHEEQDSAVDVKRDSSSSTNGGQQ
ncbi:efflux RND transporter periplasmic adaptor subunit [Silvibacterium acidisoli]|uniref:efflux RND transporter periplasmic adaptor subunit n=1 Tax=Acidobacteriaceae bacterium ZG23-2 TaxID=2883246 RepID=UPI00406CCAB6